MSRSNKDIRIGTTMVNKWGDVMKIIEYYNTDHIVVEFQDEWKETKTCRWRHFNEGSVVNPHAYKKRLGEEKLNYQGCLMKIIEYHNASNVIVEFQDNYKAQITTQYNKFSRGQIKNPYCPSVYKVGIIGNKYPLKNDGKPTKEYNTWIGMLERCCSAEYKNENPTYEDVRCCEEWLNFENFYEWLHSQPNFDKWYNGKQWEIDKDILVKGNKIYSSETCCLVPHNVNSLFVQQTNKRGSLPIGVHKYKNKYRAVCMDKHIGIYDTPSEAFYLGYKPFKENIIRQVRKKNIGRVILFKNVIKL